MPTAVVRTYSGDGFIVAADGMARDGNNVTSLQKRKIFPFGSGASMAYSLAGRTGFGPDDRPGILFRFRDLIDEAGNAVLMDQYGTLTEYAYPLKQNIQRALTEKCSAENIQFDETPSPHPGERGATIAYMFMDGYYKSLESSVTIRFYRYERRFEADVFTPGIVLGAHFYHGSTRIHDLIQEGDQRFCTGPYVRPLEVALPHFSAAMCGAILYSRAYIEACSSAVARELDPFCETIGGKIHMVSITPKDGIKWVPGFEHEEVL